jgi:hypothetical protein
MLLKPAATSSGNLPPALNTLYDTLKLFLEVEDMKIVVLDGYTENPAI